MKQNNRFAQTINAISSLVAVIIIYNLYFFLKYPYVGTDSGFYLAVARDMYSGSQYFTDIASSYNPLSIATIGIPFLFFDNPPILYFLSVNIVVMLLSSKVLYSILNDNFNNLKEVNVLLSLLLFVGFLVFEGRYVLLEPCSVFFQLLAFYIYLKAKSHQNSNQYFLAGLFVSLSFLSKQFGLFLIIPLGLDILLSNKKWFRGILSLGIGFMVPIFMLYIYYASYGESVISFLLNISGKGFEFDKGNGTGSTIGIKDLLISIIYFVLFNLYIIFIPLAFFKFKEVRTRKSLVFIVSSLCSLLVLYFASYLHYFLYVLPFFILLTGFVVQSIKRQIHKITFILSLFISCIFLMTYTFLSNKSSPEKYISQNESLVELQKYIPKKSSVYIIEPSKAYYFLGEYNSINLSKIGYCFPNYFYPKTICKNLKVGSYLIVSKEQLHFYEKELTSYDLFDVVIERKPYVIVKVL